jgi:hypothetical protein
VTSPILAVVRDFAYPGDVLWVREPVELLGMSYAGDVSPERLQPLLESGELVEVRDGSRLGYRLGVAPAAPAPVERAPYRRGPRPHLAPERCAEVGRALREARRATGLSVVRAGIRVGIPETTLRIWERGQGNPDAARVNQALDGLGASVEIHRRVEAVYGRASA